MSSTPATLPTDVDVVISGGGPTGLFLAVDLSRRGITSVVLEPRVELDWLHPRAKTTNARTMTHLRRLGLADALRDAAPLSPRWSDHVAFCTSLVGHELTRFPNAFQLVPGRYEPQPECGQQVAQPVVEQVLRSAVATAEGAHLALGTRFGHATDLGADGVETRAVDGDGVEHRLRSRYLVGADGVTSAVRKGLGLRLEGSSAGKSNLGLLFRSEQLAEKVALDPAVQYWVVGSDCAGMVGPMDLDGLWWAIVQGYDPASPRFDGVAPQELLRSLVGAEVDVEVLAEDPWTARMLLSPAYRAGNVFLAGDAAHANPPWGGHGFNTCIGDAANLAWKLAAALHGWAGPALLDTYEAERRPVARRTIDEAERNGTLLADDLMDPDLDLPGAVGDAARARAAKALAVKESEFHSLGLVLGYDYAGSPVVAGEPGAAPAPDPIRYTPSTAPGCLLPHRWLDDGRSLYDVLGPHFTVLLPAEQAAPADAVDLVERRLDDAGIGVPVVVRTVPRARGSSSPSDWLLVRPDQHVAWRGSTISGLVTALRRAVGGSRRARRPTTRTSGRDGTRLIRGRAGRTSEPPGALPMKIIGIRLGDGTEHVARLTNDHEAQVLAPLATFWADPETFLDPDADAPGTRTVDLDSVEQVPPVLPGAKVLCIGLNYLKHVEEGSYAAEGVPPFPTLFARWTSSLSVGDAPVPVPANEPGVDWEGEIVAYVGRTLVDATPEEALDAVVGYSVFNDITSRTAQKLTSQWILGKNGDRSGPLGPLVPAAEVGDLRDGLRVRTRVNGEIVQDGTTDQMVYTVGDTLSLISRTMTLRPGDLLATGTPSGVGYSRTPPWLLHPGDVVEVEVDRLGVLRTPVVGNDVRHGELAGPHATTRLGGLTGSALLPASDTDTSSDAEMPS